MMSEGKGIKILLVLGAVIIIGAGLYLYFYSSSSTSNANVVTLRSCSDIDPAVATFTSSGPVYVKNSDSMDHTLTLSGANIAMASGATTDLRSLLTYGGGTYSFDCDGIKNVGRIQIEGVNEAQASTGVSFKELYDDSMNEAQKKCAREAFAADFNDVYNGVSPMKDEGRNKFAACVTAQ